MLYPQNIEHKLGFDQVREILKETCVSSLGRDFVDKIRFSDNFDVIQKMISQVLEMKEIMTFEQASFPAQNFLDVSHHISKAAIEGVFLQETAFYEINKFLTTVVDCLRFFQNKEESSFLSLRELSDNAFSDKTDKDTERIQSNLESPIDVFKNVSQLINKIVDDRGKLKDNASSELQSIRRNLYDEQNSLRKKLDSFLKQARSNGWITDDFSLTVRNGRMMIPLMAEHKRKIKGFVHDESDSGKTVYLEPAEALDSNNTIRALELAEKREIETILRSLTTQIRPYLPTLKKANRFLGIIDFVRAKAIFALKYNGIAPIAKYQTMADWKAAFHPLLYLSFKKQSKTIVPLTLKLDSEQRILVVSGPNAGGKSVALKTIGLLQYMYQCGLLVPMKEDSVVGVFKHIFIDIGDEQSLENDLSTYSSHLTNMKHFLSFSTPKTLFLIDEFGTGTEPSLGGAIAESILEEINKTGAYGAVNTHYTNLKTFADRTPQMSNAAMKYNSQLLEPQYELEIGLPGSSFAFEIATKIGLTKEVIENAKKKLGNSQVNFEKLIKELEIEKAIFQEKNTENSTKQRKLDTVLEQYESLKKHLDNEKKNILNAAKLEAKDLLKNANKKIELTIKEIKENKAENEVTREVRQQLMVFSDGLKTEKVQKTPTLKSNETINEEPEIQVLSGEIVVGSMVRIKGDAEKDSQAFGEVMALRGKDAEVSMGALKMTIKLNRLEKISRKEFKKKNNSVGMTGIDMNEKMINFSFNLDLRGKRSEEAMMEVDSFMNDAIMLGYQELRIVHGKGDGILRTLIRNQLKGYKQVKKTSDEHADRGGAGVTIVTLN